MCKQAKSAKDAYNGFFQPLPIFERPWVNLTIDFVVDLPKNQGFNAIFIVVDQLSKKNIIYFAPKITMALMQRQQQAYFYTTFGTTTAYQLA